MQAEIEMINKNYDSVFRKQPAAILPLRRKIRKTRKWKIL